MKYVERPERLVKIVVGSEKRWATHEFDPSLIREAVRVARRMTDPAIVQHDKETCETLILDLFGAHFPDER